MRTREALALYDQGTEQAKPNEPTMNMTHATREDEAAAIWTAVVGLESGETVKQPGSLTYAAANEAADIEADKLAAQGKSVEWSGARRIA